MIFSQQLLCFTFPQWILHTMLNGIITHKPNNSFTQNFKHINYIYILFACTSFMHLCDWILENQSKSHIYKYGKDSTQHRTCMLVLGQHLPSAET